MDAITICAANYLPYAKLLGKSFLDFNPGATFTILVIDGLKISFTKDFEFKYITPEDLDLDLNSFKNMAFYYDVTELATALKPSALKYLFTHGSQKVLYLDPDIQVFAKLGDLEVQLNSHPIVLTPHSLEPIPRDGLRPSEAEIMASGTFNLGFIGLSKSETAKDFLDWWEERLRFDSISDPEEMLFTDQRWIDFVPSYFSFHTNRDPGMNVAYWNLQERRLSNNGTNYLVNNVDLKFFHFSGFRPDKPWILSKYVSDNPRITISQNLILKDLCQNYAKLALQFGWTVENSKNYGYDKFESGKKIPQSLRRLFREDCINAAKQNQAINPPSDWQSWASKRSVESGNLSRILFGIWKSRPDLKRRYPDATGNEFREFQSWASSHGVSEGVIDKDLIAIGELESDVYPTTFTNKKGANVAGYLSGEFGLGQSARLIYTAARAAGIKVSTLNSSRTRARQEEKVVETDERTIFPVVISVVNADHFELWKKDLGDSRLKYSKIIGVWAWETEDFPISMHKAFDYVDELWVVSRFVKDAISKHTKKKVFVLPSPIIKPENISKLDRNSINLPENAEYNLFIFDYMSVFNRKNPMGVAAAHMNAFPNQEGPKLIIKTTNGNSDAENREKLKMYVQERSDILIIEEYFSRSQLTALINECSIYISLHRSEGYGLTMAEAMSLAKPVVATGYSGNLDFMNSENSILVPFTMTAVGSDAYPYSDQSKWADPDIDYAAKAINKLFRDKELKERLGRSAQEFVTQEFSLAKTSEFLSERVDRNYSIFTKSKIRLNIYIDSLNLEKIINRISQITIKVVRRIRKKFK